MDALLPAIPAKRYFTIGEVSDLCGVKPHVLRYWEQEFTQLRPMKRRGNRRYYQHHEVLMIRRIRDLLYDQGFTISGARNKLHEITQSERGKLRGAPPGEDDSGMPLDAGMTTADGGTVLPAEALSDDSATVSELGARISFGVSPIRVPLTPSRDGIRDLAGLQQLQRELREIRDLLAGGI
ncbi:MAG: MerR family transcriptional regulator [Betaproteobacteria bacterium]|nr:MerR family transcriptional regulator [Betaproteobacteria bacterium]